MNFTYNNRVLVLALVVVAVQMLLLAGVYGGNPKKSHIFERMKFYHIKQGSETFDCFLRKLRTAAVGCEFVNDTSMKKDFIIMGINNKKLREKRMSM